MKFILEDRENYLNESIRFVRTIELMYDEGVFRIEVSYSVTDIDHSEAAHLSARTFERFLEFIHEESKLHKKALS